MVWHTGLRTKMQAATQALAQPADIQLRLLPSFVCPAPYMLDRFIQFFQDGIHDNRAVTTAEKAILFEVRKSMSRLFKDIRGSGDYMRASYRDSSLPARIASLLHSPDEWENTVGILSRKALETGSEWQELRGIARDALRLLDWMVEIPSPLWQPMSVKLKGSYHYWGDYPKGQGIRIDEEAGEEFVVEVLQEEEMHLAPSDWTSIDREIAMETLQGSSHYWRDYSSGGISIDEKYVVRIVQESEDLLLEHSYCDDPHSGTKWIHRLNVAASEKAYMLTLLKRRYDFIDSLVPPDAQLLDLIYTDFYTLQQLRIWLQQKAIPFSVRHEDRY